MKIYSAELVEARAKYFFKIVDTNDDKKISKEEFINTCLNDEFMLNLLIPVMETSDE